MSRRSGYEKVSLDDSIDTVDDDDRETESLLPSANPRRSSPEDRAQRSTSHYYDESHLTENFTEAELNSEYNRWGVGEMAQAAAQAAGNVTPQQVAGGVKTACFFLRWLPTYDVAENLMPDISAGVTVGVVLVAQGVAYGLLTGLPAYYGLYASIPPAFVYALLGTSRQMHIGPFALVSLLVAEGCVNGGYDPDVDQQAYVDAVMTMSLVCSFIYLAMWVLRLGFVVEILSDPTMSAMTTASAFLICTSQMRHFFGLTGIPRASFLETWGAIISKLPETNWTCVFIALSSLGIQFGIAKLNKKLKLKVPIPEQLIVVIVSTWFVWAFSLDNACFPRTDVDVDPAALECSAYFTNNAAPPPPTGNVTDAAAAATTLSETAETDCPLDRCYWDDSSNVRTLGYVPSGLPSLYIPDVSSAGDTLEGSIVVAVVSIALCIATAKTFADKNGYEIDTNQELLALGVSNLVGGVFQCYPAASSLSRSALAQTVGAKTQLWNVFCCGIIVVVLLFLVDLLRTLPNAALAAIILIAFKSILKQLSEVKRLWALSKPDCFVWVTTFVTCLAFGVKVGIACGIIASIGATLKTSLRPYHALLGRLRDTDVYRDVRRYPDAVQDPGIIAFRFDGPIVFANRDFLKQTLTRLIDEKQAHTATAPQDDSYDSDGDGIEADEMTAAAEAADLTPDDPKPIDKLFVSMHAAVEYARRRGRTRRALSDGTAPQLHTVILQCTSVNMIDSSGLSTLRKLCNELKSGAMDGPRRESHTVHGTLSRSMRNLPAPGSAEASVAKPIESSSSSTRGALQPLPPLCVGISVVLVGCTGTVRDTLYAADMAARTKPALTPLTVATAAAHWHRHGKGSGTMSGREMDEDALSPTISAGAPSNMGSPDGSPRLNDEHEERKRGVSKNGKGEKGEGKGDGMAVSAEEFEKAFSASEDEGNEGDQAAGSKGGRP